MATDTTRPSLPYRAPDRAGVALPLLFFGLCGGAVAWIVQLIVDYALASHFCFPHETPRSDLGSGGEGIGAVLLIVNLAALVVALGAAVVSLRNWRRGARAEQLEPAEGLLAAGKGRTRFLATFGGLANLGFLAAILFTSVALFTVPQCGG